MWSVTLSKSVNSSGQKVFSLTYINGDRTIVDTFLVESYISDAHVADLANTRIAGLTQEQTNYDAINEGTVTPSPAPIVTPTPDPVVVAQQAYMIARLNLIQGQQDLSLGLITQDDFNALLEIAQEAKSNLPN